MVSRVRVPSHFSNVYTLRAVRCMQILPQTGLCKYVDCRYEFLHPEFCLNPDNGALTSVSVKYQRLMF